MAASSMRSENASMEGHRSSKNLAGSAGNNPVWVKPAPPCVRGLLPFPPRLLVLSFTYSGTQPAPTASSSRPPKPPARPPGARQKADRAASHATSAVRSCCPPRSAKPGRPRSAPTAAPRTSCGSKLLAGGRAPSKYSVVGGTPPPSARGRLHSPGRECFANAMAPA